MIVFNIFVLFFNLLLTIFFLVLVLSNFGQGLIIVRVDLLLRDSYSNCKWEIYKFIFKISRWLQLCIQHKEGGQIYKRL